MRSLGRIEQKADDTKNGIAEIKEALKDHDDRISKVETTQATAKGIVTVLALAWSAIVAAISTLVTIYFTRGK